MKLDNKTYILRSDLLEELDSYSYNTSTGIVEIRSGWKGTTLLTILPQAMTYGSRKPIFIPFSDILGTVEVIMFDKNNNFIGSVSTVSNSTNICELNINTYKIGVNFQIGSNYNEDIERMWFYCGYPVEAHYSKLEKKLSRQSEQMFFRESINGNIILVGQDFEYVRNTSLEQNMLFAFYANSILKAKSEFNKTDCKFDYFKKNVTLKLNAVDSYTDILNKYENTYDLIKLAPAITKLTLTKRMAYQIYIKGANDTTTIANGTYWQDDVNEVIDDENALQNKYKFNKVYTFREIHLSGLNAFINGTYVQSANEVSWPTKGRDVNGQIINNADCDIYFNKIYSQGQVLTGETISGPFKNFSDGNDTQIQVIDVWDQTTTVLIDIYKIQIRRYDYITQQTIVVYESSDYYIIDNVNNGFLLAIGDNLYKMVSTNPQLPILYLGENTIEYEVYARIIADIDSIEIGGETIQLYDLPLDDFTYTRANYKKCIGVSANSDYWKIYQVRATSEDPTKYGIDDYGRYFSSNFAPLISGNNVPIPISRNSWANTSLWFVFTDLYWVSGYENNYRVEYTLKDAYCIADVIKVMLKEINPNLKHEATSDYSEFLYGNTASLSFGNKALYIAPKSNILKGNYDQAAQKAEITFKQLMDMLKNCFRCYWFIDSQNRFRIEHISYFMNGMSYSTPSSYIDFTIPSDKFNKKKVLYCQEEIEFEKSELSARYEYTWSDDSTDIFGNNYIDVISQYVQKDKTENINPDLFSADIDFMLFAPDKFSSDGFALIIANKETKKVPIVELASYFKDSEYVNAYTASVQNWYASWLYLIRYYMYDMPAITIKSSGIANQLSVSDIKKSMKNSIQYSSFEEISEFAKVKTNIGIGIIDEISVNLSTGLISTKVGYNPS